MVMTRDKAVSIVHQWREFAKGDAPVRFDRTTIRGLLEVSQAMATLYGGVSMKELDAHWPELMRAIGILIVEERARTTKQIAESNASTVVALAVLDAHLKSLSDYASAFTTRRAKLLDGTPSPLLQAALGIGKGLA